MGNSGLMAAMRDKNASRAVSFHLGLQGGRRNLTPHGNPGVLCLFDILRSLGLGVRRGARCVR